MPSLTQIFLADSVVIDPTTARDKCHLGAPLVARHFASGQNLEFSSDPETGEVRATRSDGAWIQGPDVSSSQGGR